MLRLETHYVCHLLRSALGFPSHLSKKKRSKRVTMYLQATVVSTASMRLLLLRICKATSSKPARSGFRSLDELIL